MSNREDLKLAIFLCKHYHYQMLSISGNVDESWVINTHKKEANIIRITTKDTKMIDDDKNMIMKILNDFKSKFNQLDFINVHLGDYNIMEDTFKTTIMYESKIKGYDLSLVFSDLDYLEIKDEEVKLWVEKIKLQTEKLRETIKKSKRKPIVTYSLIAICIVIFCLINYFTFTSDLYDIGSRKSLFGLLFGSYYKGNIVYYKEYFRLITHGFVHLDPLHLGFNMYALYILGVRYERICGNLRFLLLMLISILTSSLAIFFLNGNIMAVGISGGIYGIFGYMIIDIFTSGAYKNPLIRNNILKLLIMNLMISLLPGISLTGHLGGFVGGSLVALCYSNNKTLAFNAKISLIFLIIFALYQVFTVTTLGDVNDNNLVIYYQFIHELKLDSYLDYLSKYLSSFL